MNINIYDLNTLTAADKARILRRPELDIEGFQETVRPITIIKEGGAGARRRSGFGRVLRQGTPPTPEGPVDDASLFTARVCGIKTVYKTGGAQAIAAMAFGTEAVKKVHKVIGPGNAYVSAAKRLLYGR